MLRKLLVLTAGMILWSALATADDATKPGKAKVEPVSLAVNKKLDEKKYPYRGAMCQAGLMLSWSGKHLLSLDPSSKVSDFQDDKGNSLVGTFKPVFSQTGAALDRSSMLVTVYGSNVAPGKGATKIIVKGELVVVCGLDEKTTEEKTVALKEKTEVKFGKTEEKEGDEKDKPESKMADFTLKVTREKGFVTAGATFQIISKRPVKGVTVKDADGKVIDGSPFNFYYNAFGKTWFYEYNLKKAAKEAKISITWFAKEEKQTVPVDLAFGVGL